MPDVTVSQAAEELGISAARVRALCGEGRIVGARKIGRDWLIPTPIKRIPVRRGRPRRYCLPAPGRAPPH